MNFARELFSKRNRVLLKEMVKTDFKLRYQGSVLGILWSVIKPMALFLVMYVVFINFLRFGATEPKASHFAMQLLLAMVIWQFFSETVMQGMMSIVSRGDLLRKINFPKVIVVISASVGALISFGINLVVVVVLSLINGVQFNLSSVFAVFPFIELYFFALGLALLLGALFVKFRDIAHIWEVAMQMFMYSVPIIWPLSMIIDHHLLITKIILLNPLAQIIQDARNLMIYSHATTTWGLINNWFITIIPIIITVFMFLIGLFYFNKQSQKFAEEV